MEGMPNKINVSVAMDKESLHADVALRDLSRPNEAHLLTPKEARHIAAMLVHAAMLVETSGVLAHDLAERGSTHEQIAHALETRYRVGTTEYKRPDEYST